MGEHRVMELLLQFIMGAGGSIAGPSEAQHHSCGSHRGRWGGGPTSFLCSHSRHYWFLQRPLRKKYVSELKPRDSSLPRPQHLPTPDSKDHHRHARLMANGRRQTRIITRPGWRPPRPPCSLCKWLLDRTQVWPGNEFSLASWWPQTLIPVFFGCPKCTANRQTALSSVLSNQEMLSHLPWFPGVGGVGCSFNFPGGSNFGSRLTSDIWVVPISSPATEVASINSALYKPCLVYTPTSISEAVLTMCMAGTVAASLSTRSGISLDHWTYL